MDSTYAASLAILRRVLRLEGALADVSAFAGFPPEAFAWFSGLEADNTRQWFAAHRDTYEIAVRGAFEAMLDELADDARRRA